MKVSSREIGWVLGFFFIPTALSAQTGDIELNAGSIQITQEIDNTSYNRIIMVDDSGFSGGMGYSYLSVAPQKDNLINFLRSQNIQKQIEFSAEQKNEFNAIQKKFSEGLAKISTRYAHRSDKKIASELRTQFTAKYKEEVKKFRADIEKEIKESLVPQQVKLVKQIQFNQSVKIWGFAHTVSKAPYSDQIKTSKNQSANILKIKKEAEAEIRKAIVEIRAKAKAKMMKEFDRKQKDKIRELEGDSKKKSAVIKL